MPETLYESVHEYFVTLDFLPDVISGLFSHAKIDYTKNVPYVILTIPREESENHNSTSIEVSTTLRFDCYSYSHVQSERIASNILFYFKNKTFVYRHPKDSYDSYCVVMNPSSSGKERCEEPYPDAKAVFLAYQTFMCKEIRPK